MHTLNPTTYANDLRYALEVLDEYEHLGLDQEHASKLRSILIRQIEGSDETVQASSLVQPIRFPVDRD